MRLFTFAIYLGLLGSAATGCSGEDVTIRFSPTLNKPYIYTTTEKSTRTYSRADGSAVPPLQTTTTSRTISIVADSKSASGIHCILKILDAASTEPKSPNTDAKGAQIEMTCNDQGRATSAKTDSTNLIVKALAKEYQEASLPAKPVHVGSTWTYALDVAQLAGDHFKGQPVSVNNTVQKIENGEVTLQSIYDARLTMNTNSLHDVPVTLHNDATGVMRLSDGMTLQSTATMTTTIVAGRITVASVRTSTTKLTGVRE
jgi:hypothetical protein